MPFSMPTPVVSGDGICPAPIYDFAVQLCLTEDRPEASCPGVYTNDELGP